MKRSSINRRQPIGGMLNKHPLRWSVRCSICSGQIHGHGRPPEGGEHFQHKVCPASPRPDRSAEFASHVVPAPAPAVMAQDLAARAPMVIDKERPLDCEAYRKYVAALPCWLCHIEGYSQAAHADEGKGMAIKSDDRTCYPACGPHSSAHGQAMMIYPGCHWLIGTSGTFTRDHRRHIEALAGAETQQRLRDWATTDTVLRQLLQRIELMP